MDQTLLVGPDLAAGAEALATLDAAGIRPVVALMAVFPEYEDWRFVLSSPDLDQAHLLKAHLQVSKVLRGTFVDTLPTIMIFPTRDPFIRQLRKLFAKTADVEGMRLGGQRIGSKVIDAAFVYRVK